MSSRASKLSAARIVLGYAGIAALWVAFSDLAVVHLGLAASFHTIKGITFVGVTAYLLYLTISRLVDTVRRTSQERDEAATLYRTVVEASGDGICLLDKCGRISFLNGQLAAILGRPVGELKGQRFKDVIDQSDSLLADSGLSGQAEAHECREKTHPAQNPFARSIEGDGRLIPDNKQPVIVALRTGEAVRNVEMGIAAADGSLKWVSVNAQPVRDDHGNLLGAVVSFFDITERKRGEEALRRSERQFRELADAMPQIVWAARPDGYIDYYNRRGYDLTGLAAGQGNHRWLPVLHPDDRQRCLDTWHESLSTGKPYQIEYRFKVPGRDAYRWYLARALPVRDDPSRIVRWYGTCTDIHDFKQAEERQRASEERLAGIIGSAMDAIVTIDQNYKIVVFNHAAEKTFGVSAADAIGKPFDRFIPGRFREDHRQNVAEFGRTGRTNRSMTSPATLVGLRSDGTEFPMEAAISRIEAGGEKLYTVILRDVTERVRAEEALIRSERLAATGRLAATIAHEINNPLGAVTNILYLLRQSVVDEQGREYLHIIDKQIEAMSRIANQTLKFHRNTDQPSAYRLSELVGELVEFYIGKARKHGVVLSSRVATEGVLVGLSGEMRQVLSNLIVNAIEATPQAGKVTVHLYQTKDWSNPANRGYRVVVCDSGCGIAREHRARIFEPFFTTKGDQGTGLGLWVSAGIIKRAGGRMHVLSSCRPGRSGTCFSIFLPIEAVAAAAGRAPSTIDAA